MFCALNTRWIFRREPRTSIIYSQPPSPLLAHPSTGNKAPPSPSLGLPGGAWSELGFTRDINHIPDMAPNTIQAFSHLFLSHSERSSFHSLPKGVKKKCQSLPQVIQRMSCLEDGTQSCDSIPVMWTALFYDFLLLLLPDSLGPRPRLLCLALLLQPRTLSYLRIYLHISVQLTLLLVYVQFSSV